MTNKRHKIWLAIIGGLVLVLTLLILPTGVVWGVTWNIPGTWGSAADSAHFKLRYEDGTLRDSALYSTTVYDIETTLTVSNDSAYQAVIYIWWTGEDSSTAWSFFRDAATSASITTSDKQEIAGYVDDTLEGEHGGGAWTSGTGSGSNTVKIYAIDSTIADTAVEGVAITIKTLAGVQDGIAQNTSSSGFVTFTLTADTFIVLGRKFGYSFPLDTIIISGATTDSIEGDLTFSVASPEGDSTCTVYGHIYDFMGDSVQYEPIRISLPDGTYNSCNSKTILTDDYITKTTVAGYWSANLIWSSCLNDHDYTITINKRSYTFTVPDSTSYLLTLGK